MQVHIVLMGLFHEMHVTVYSSKYEAILKTMFLYLVEFVWRNAL